MLADLRAGRDPDAELLAGVIGDLRRIVTRLYPDLDADEIVQSTMVRLLARSRQPDTPDDAQTTDQPRTEIKDASAYLVTATRNAAIDALRARTRQRRLMLGEAPEELASDDDAVAGLLDSQATNAAVLGAMRAALRAGDRQTVRIITIWLDLADERRKPPSTRQVAARAGVSHTTVAAALRRFKALLTDPS